MRVLLIALLLALLAPAAAAEYPPLTVEQAAWAANGVALTAIVPPGAIEVCGASPRLWVCTPGIPGEIVALVVPGRPGDRITVWGVDRSYTNDNGGITNVMGLVRFDAPSPPHVTYLPGVLRGETNH